jgi:hypothetical protein
VFLLIYVHAAGTFQPEEVHQFSLSLHRRMKQQSTPQYLFRFLSGSGLRSPRCRYDGVACVVLRYFREGDDRRGWYLIRTARTVVSRAVGGLQPKIRRRCFRLHLVRQLDDPCPAASFDWILRE